MTDPKQIAELRGLLERATPGEWMVQDGCSWRRIGTHFHDGDVLAPTTSRTDGWPDLTAHDGRRDYNLALIVAMKNALPSLLASAEREVRYREALEELWRLIKAAPEDDYLLAGMESARDLLTDPVDVEGV